jgi:class 3 adenylate cyclase/CheY-like chemotaxis protein/phosphoribosyl 1,2-cyclic phosphodiesterase
VAHEIHFDVWGARGSRSILPPRSAIANHTSCYSLYDGENLFVLDAGRGLASLAHALISEERFAPVRNLHVLVSHAHMDHWEGFKDAEWFWRRGNRLRVRVYGTLETLDTIRAGYAHPHYVPLELLAKATVERLEYQALSAGEELRIGRLRLRTAGLNHYSGEGASINRLDTVGFRLSLEGGPTIVYLSDHEPTPDSAPMEDAMAGGADLVLLDSHFLDVAQHAHGHGSQEYTAGLARRHPEALVMAAHHGPLFTDAEIEAARERHASGLANYALAVEGDVWAWPAGATSFTRRRRPPLPTPEDPAARALRSKARHDLRTPINQIIGYAELLTEQVEEEGRRDLVSDLEKIRAAARRQLELIGEHLAEPGDGAAASRGPTTSDSGRHAIDTSASGAYPAVAAGELPDAGERGHGQLLVVDDNPANRDMLSRRLEARGYSVATAADGRQALDLVAQREFELILLDVMMPGLSGLDVLKILREGHSASDLPVIMATARDASEDVVTALGLGANDYVTKPLDFPVVMARVQAQLALKRQKDEIERLAQDLEVRNRFIRVTFGRYLSEEIVEGLLESPEGLKLGGESRRVTMLMSDLRGFTAVSERLGPEQVVRMLNIYLGAMADIIMRYQGTIDEFVGDAILALFGAPVSRDDDAARAVACAVQMQNAMEDVNATLEAEGMPRIEMGVAVHTGEVVVGNIGSQKRTKYGIVGPPVNLTGRIESYTVGGQVLVSEDTVGEVGGIVEVGERIHVKAKGSAEPVTVFDLIGIGGGYDVSLPRREDALRTIIREVPIRFWILEGKRVGDDVFEGAFVRLSVSGAQVRSTTPLRALSNLKIEVRDEAGRPVAGALYAKVLEADGEGSLFRLRFTSVPPEIQQHLGRLLGA